MEKNYTKLAGALLFTSGAMFLIFTTIAEAASPGYSIRDNSLSDLGRLGAPTELFWNGQLFVSGVLGFLAIYFLFFRAKWPTPDRVGNPVRILFLLPSIGAVTVSLFPENFALAIHAAGALANFVLGAIAALYAYKLTEPPFKYLSVVLGVISLVSLGLIGTDTLFGFGLVERMIAYPLVIWNVSFGTYLMALKSE